MSNENINNVGLQNQPDPPPEQADNGAGSNFIKPPKPLQVCGNIANNWKLWSQQYEWFEEATRLDRKSQKVQIGTFMSCIGADAVTIFNTFGLEGPALQLGTIKERFSAYFTPKTNVTYERYTFNKLNQAEGETFDEFFTKVKTQSAKCEFAVLTDSLVRDKIIVGIRNDKVREKLLSEEVTLDRATQICRASELASSQLKSIQKDETPDVNAITKMRRSKKSSSSSTSKSFDCKRCGRNHNPKECPAFNQKCNKCKKNGHYAKMCQGSKTKDNKVHAVKDDSDEYSEDDNVYINAVSTNNDDDKNWIESIKIGNINVDMKLDSGAQCNVLPKRIANKIGAQLYTSQTKRIITYSGHNIDVAGELKTSAIIRSKKVDLKFIVVKEDVTPVLGKASCESSGLIMRIKEIRESVFDGLGCLKNFEYDIDFIDNPQFEIHAARRIPHAYRESVQKELESMVRQQVIVPITEATPAVSPMVIVKQRGKIRICIDPTDVNKNVLRRHYPLTTMDEIAAKISGATVFTKLDCKKGFWQIKLSERTQKYLTFATPWGRFSCLKLPFGLCSAPEVFQQIMSKLLVGIKNAEVSMDDILIFGENIESLKKTQEAVINRIEKAGLKLNKDKCVFEARKIKFLGHIISANGMELDEEKVEAIKQLKTPVNKTELQRFLGMVTYLSKFIPNMSSITHPLRKLLEKDIEWLWTEEQTAAVSKLKQVLSSPPVLKFYNVNDDVTLQVDASSYALGAALLQRNQPVAYASRSLTKTECRYPQIEKEALAIRYGCTKFHQYIYGKKLTIETDHKPLESICKKPIGNAPPRLQRILMDLSPYGPEVIYRKGATMFLADILSRDCINETPNDAEEIEVLSILSVSDNAIARIQKATKNDNQLQQLLKVVLNGWPSNQTDLPSDVKAYWNFRDELSSYNDLIYKGQKIVIPASEKQKTLEQIHLGHFGVQRTLSLAREHVFWLNMTNDIVAYVERCSVCQQTQRSNNTEPLINKQIPKYPFEIVATDIFSFQKYQYLLTVDSYSGFFDFRMLNQATSKEVILCLKSLFAVHGIPAILETDNGPQYASKEFRDFANQWNFEHRTSSPKYPKSNGLAERFVQTAKGMLRKCTLDGTDVNLALLNYRNTPRDRQLGSPNQRLMSRKTRSVLPTNEELLKPKVITKVTDQLADLRKIQKDYHDRNTVHAPTIKVGDDVRMQRGNRDWIAAKVTQQSDKPRSFIVEANNGRQYRRNTIHLRQTPAKIVEPPSVVVTPSTQPPEQQINDQPPDQPQNHAPVQRSTTNSTMRQRTQTDHRAEPSIEPIRSRYGRLIKKVVRMDL